jgi:hypothetical protein
MILFVASNPSKLNTDVKIAMVGSKSEKNFNAWSKYLVPDGQYQVVNVSDVVLNNGASLKKADYNLSRLEQCVKNTSVKKVIALGNNAADALEMIGIKYFKLPHPSPRNRFLNFKVQVEAVLTECKKWLNN